MPSAISCTKGTDEHCQDLFGPKGCCARILATQVPSGDLSKLQELERPSRRLHQPPAAEKAPTEDKKGDVVEESMEEEASREYEGIC